MVAGTSGTVKNYEASGSRMRAISISGLSRPSLVAAGPTPVLQWLRISDLVIDPLYHRPITSGGRRKIERIAQSFSWSCFLPVIVAPIEGAKFAIIDGQQRTTAAALAGLEEVPCQIIAVPEQDHALAFSTINHTGRPPSRLTSQAGNFLASEPQAIQLAEICSRAGVELLRYPVPVDRQASGQTMAIGAIAQCLKRYGEETLITALQCITQTTNNRPGVLSARTIKAICAILGNNPPLRDSGLALLETFDAINLAAIAEKAATGAVKRKIRTVQLMADLIRSEIDRLAVRKTGRENMDEPTVQPTPKVTYQNSVKRMVDASLNGRVAFVPRVKSATRTKPARDLRPVRDLRKS